MTVLADVPDRATTVALARRPIFERALRDRRRSLIAWGVGLGVYVAMIVATWPSIHGSTEITKAIQSYPDAMKEFFGGAAAFDYARPGGFLNTQLFSLILPLLLTIVAIGQGAAALASDQRAGQLDLELSLPLTRSRIVAEKALGLTAAITGLTLVSGAVILVVGLAVDLRIGFTNITAACLGAGLVALLHGLLALDVSARSGNRGLALGVSTAVFVAGYLIQALSGLVDAIRPLRWLSPLYHANGTIPINTGFPIGHDLVLAVVCAALAAGAVRLFEQRDVTS